MVRETDSHRCRIDQRDGLGGTDYDVQPAKARPSGRPVPFALAYASAMTAIAFSGVVAFQGLTPVTTTVSNGPSGKIGEYHVKETDCVPVGAPETLVPSSPEAHTTLNRGREVVALEAKDGTSLSALTSNIDETTSLVFHASPRIVASTGAMLRG